MTLSWHSPEEPRGGGQTGRPQHHPEERDWLSAESHQWSTDHHHPSSSQPPTYTAICAHRRRTGGTRAQIHIWRKLLFVTESVCWQSFQSGFEAVGYPSISHEAYSSQLQCFSKASLSVNGHLGLKHLITAVIISSWMLYEIRSRLIISSSCLVGKCDQHFNVIFTSFCIHLSFVCVFCPAANPCAFHRFSLPSQRRHSWRATQVSVCLHYWGCHCYSRNKKIVITWTAWLQNDSSMS